jgi:Undecaprenyl-phosphate glucose phosphotransferase
MKENRLLLVYIMVDLCLLNLAIFVAYCFNLGDCRHLPQRDLHFYVFQANMAWIVTYFIFVKNNLYLRDAFRHRVYRIIRRTILFVLVVMAMTFVFIKNPVARMFMFSYISLFFSLEVLFYWLFYTYLNHRRTKGLHSQRILLIGYGEVTNLFRQMIASTPMLGYQFMGYVVDTAREEAKIPEEERRFILGGMEDLERIIEENRIQVVFSAFSFLGGKVDIDDQLAACNKTGIRMYLVAENQRWIRKSHGVESLGDFYILNPQRIPLDDATNRVVKRVFDVTFSALILLLFGWNLLLLVALIIKLTSRGPAIFSQERTGLNNVPFPCYKFRSMRVNKDANKQQATKNDARITPFGRFMRRWSIDEFPQFYNVLCGQMSIVGPRPHMLIHTEQYSALINNYRVRHYVKPGITGWAQVNGWRGETDCTWKMEKRVSYDMDYIENWSFLWDLQIIILTIFGKNAGKNAG